MKKSAIILVDDEMIILQSLRTQLKRDLGDLYEIELAESGEEGMEIFNELKADSIEIPLVISDQIMPGMKGDEFLEFVYKTSKDTRTIMLTGQADVTSVGKAVNNAKLYRFIAKPWDEVDLNMTIKEAIKSYQKNKKIEEQSIELKKLVEELQDANENLEKRVIERTKKVVEQKRLIELKNEEITSSIEYAKRIQKAILPLEAEISKLLPGYFIFYQPKDIVSGDFYWFTQKGNKSIIVAADCTGHGVPGAFMSMLGISMLDDIVNHQNIVQSDLILNKLKDSIIKSLHQTNNKGELKDGMDLSLLIIDRVEMTLQFSGAYNPLLIIRNNELYTHKADRMPVGFHFKHNTTFSKTDLNLEKDDMLYIFSDGYTDQFGGVSNKKFMMKQFKSLLLEIHHQPLKAQKKAIKERFFEWKSSYPQTDDIIIIGIKV